MNGHDASQTFADVTRSILNADVEQWKADGKRVIGYFCAMVPEEVFTAAGMLPFRMRGTGSDGTELSDAHFGSINCSLPRHAINQVLRGEYGFLDGLVCANSCDHIRRVYDIWKRSIDTSFVHIMALPKTTSDSQIDWYAGELSLLRGALEDRFELKISDGDIAAAIKLHNKIRALQRQIYELRRADDPPLTGAETLEIMVAGTAMPKQRYAELLAARLAALAGADGIRDYRARLMIVGGELDDPEYVRTIEDQGGLVVTDSNCYGTRTMWELVDEGDPDPIRALAKYYIRDRPSCPLMFGAQPQRIDYVRGLAREFKVDGIIGERLMFCDAWAFEHYMMKQDLAQDRMPFLQIDREYISSGRGQLRTRIQAFIETLESGKEDRR